MNWKIQIIIAIKNNIIITNIFNKIKKISKIKFKIFSKKYNVKIALINKNKI